MPKPPRPRIAVLSPFIDKRHGTERCIAEQIERLAKTFEIHLYSSRVADIDLTNIVWHRVWIPPGPHLFGFLWWLFANRLCRFWHRLRGLRPDLIYSPGINCFDADLISVHVLFTNVRKQFANAKRASSSPSRSWLQTLHLRIYYWLLAVLEKRVYSNKRITLVAVSQKTAGELRQIFRRDDPVEVIYHGVDCAEFSPARRQALRRDARMALRLDDDVFVVLLIGNDWRNKGLPCVLDAAGKLRKPSIHVLVVGEDSPRPYDELIEKLNLKSQVSFPAPRNDVEFYYSAADVYVGPSLEDTFSLPPAEAMACGLPAITTRAAGVSEIIHDGVDGVILENPLDSDTLSNWLERLLNDLSLRKQIGDAATKTAALYTWDKNAHQLQIIMEKLLPEKGKN
ncbi:MAG TPA: glycosyltransferase family 4 protein [Candidatus Acidoferrum sp.]|nr:glycosyltransferase family 4 protein [Candidatus Acidoferrum sp.]